MNTPFPVVVVEIIHYTIYIIHYTWSEVKLGDKSLYLVEQLCTEYKLAIVINLM